MPSAQPDGVNFQPSLAACTGIKKDCSRGQGVEAVTACARKQARLFN